MKLLRLFIAIELLQDLKEEIAKVSWQLAKQNLPFRFEDEVKLHITLAFLGNTKVEKIQKLEKILNHVARNISPFFLLLTNLGAFPGFNHPRILYIGLTGETDSLERLQKNLLKVLKDAGFIPKTNDTFTPHITLARFAKPPYPIHMKKMGNKISGLKIKIPKLEFAVNSISLMQSKLTPKGSNYKTLKTFNFSS